MNLDDDILIENFLRNQLSKSEIIDFNKKLQTNKEFKDHFVFEKQLFCSLNKEEWSFIENKNNSEYKEYYDLFNDEKTKSLKKTLKAVNKSYQSNTNKLFNKKWIYLVAAAILMFFVISKYFLISNSPKNLFTTYFNQTELPSLVVRGTDEITLSKVQQLFDDKKFNEAIPFLEKEINNGKTNSTLLIYLGISQMESNMYNKSLETFNSIINNESLITTKAYWFKALLYLKMNRIEESKNLLIKIKSKKLYNFNKASELLEDLDGI